MEKHNINQNPTGIWQGIWADLFRQINMQMTAGQYSAAWFSLQLIKVQLPPECIQDTEADFLKASKIMQTVIEGYGYMEIYQNKKRQIAKDAPEVILSLLGKIVASLYIHHWINKDFTVKPLKQDSPHITSEA
jgi:hypothetical protein